MRGRNPSAAPGLEDGRGLADFGWSSFALSTCPSLSSHAINPRAKHDLLGQDASASTKFGKSAKIQLFFKVL